LSPASKVAMAATADLSTFLATSTAILIDSHKQKPPFSAGGDGAGAGSAAQPMEPRRRKLVRGGNKKDTPVLEEFTVALAALDDLDGTAPPLHP
jgi:hypothetical protein